MTNFNVTFETKKGRIGVYEGEDSIVLSQNEGKIVIPIKDWEVFYASIKIANKKRRKN